MFAVILIEGVGDIVDKGLIVSGIATVFIGFLIYKNLPEKNETKLISTMILPILIFFVILALFLFGVAYS